MTAWVAFSDPEYSPPTPMEIREVLKTAGLTGREAGERLGVNGRTVRKWTGGQCQMPYSAWRLLLVQTGHVNG